MEGVNELQSVDLGLKIRDFKVLELGIKKKDVEDEDYQILNIKTCQELKEAQIALAKISFENFHNIFVITLQVLCLKNEELEKFLSFLCKNISNSREFFLQIKFVESNEWQVYLKTKNAEKFTKIDLSNDKKLFLSRFKINKKLDAKNFYEILKFLNCSLVDVDFSQILNFLSLSSADDKLFLIKNAIKVKDELSVKLLMLFVNKLSQDLLDEALRSNSVNFIILILKNFSVNDVSEDMAMKILNHKLGDEFLIKVACQDYLNILQIFLKHEESFFEFLKYKTWCKIIKNAQDNNFHDICSVLQTFEIKFYEENPNDKIGKNSRKKIKLDSKNITIEKEIEQLHKHIEGGNLIETKKIVSIFPEFKICMHDDKCALQKSIEVKNFEIYAYLVSKNFLVFNEENFEKLFKELSEVENQKIFEENLKFCKSNPDDFINILATKIKLFAGGIKLSFAELREMLEKLKGIKENRKMMRIAAQANFTITSDFFNMNVHKMVPIKNKNVMGTVIKENIFFGKNISKKKQYGTFAHELMHFVLLFIYENRALPYCKIDFERELEWGEIVRNLKFQSKEIEMDDILLLVFTAYSDNKTEDEKNNPNVVAHVEKVETAVRVNHLLTLYQDNDEKIVELEALHPQLFSFIRTKVLADLKIPNVYRMIKLNNDFGLLQRTEDSELQVKPTDKSEILNLVTDVSKRVLIVTNVPQLMLSKIRNEIKNLPGNKLNLKARNIFVDLIALEQKHVKEEFLSLIETTEVDRIITDFCDFEADFFELNTENPCFFVVTQENKELASKFNFKKQPINIKWNDLTEESRKLLLEKPIKFQGKEVKISKILFDVENSITPEILPILCSESEIKVNCESEVEKLEKFIDRTIQMKKKVKVSDDSTKRGLKLDQEIEFYEEDAEPKSHNFNPISQPAGASSGSKSKKVKFALIYEDFSLKNFIDKTQNEQILIISDNAGSGKTTLLKKILEMLIQKFPFHFIIFIPLLKYVDELAEGVGESFTEFIAKVLKFKSLEKKIFMQKYAKGEVKILFDAFDEISPKCKENTTKLFQNFLKNSKNQIFITTRTHLEHDLEKDLKVLAQKIKNLTKEEQVAFVVEYWGNKDRVLVEKSAKKLVNKISEIIATKTSLIGVPLIVQGLAEAFKDKIDENFEREIENLDISSVYEKIVENFFSKFKDWCLQNNPKIIENMTMSPLQLHQYLAICLFFSEEFANLLGLNHDEDEWPMEGIARCGLINYDKVGKFHFNHQTNAEHFIAGFTFHLLKTVKKLSSVNLDFMFKVLTDEKFEVVRMFLDSKLNKVEKVQDLKSFNSSREICEKVKNDKNFLQLCVSEGLFSIFEFFALAVKKCDIKLFKEIIELKDNEDEATNLMIILPYASDLTKFKIFLNEILNFYSENIFDDFLLKVNKYGDTILHYFSGYCKNKQIFECFWNKIKDFFDDEKKLKSFLLMKGQYGRNALLLSIACQNENTFYFLFEQVFCKIFSIKEFAYESAESGENLLHFLASYGSVSMLKFAIEKLKNEFSPEDLQNFIKLKSKDGGNLLHFAASDNENEKSVEFLVNFIKNEVGSDEVKKMLSELDNYKNLPLHCAVELNNLKVFEFFFSFYEQSFDKMQIFQFLCEKNETGDNLLHRAAAFVESKEVFEFLWMKIEKLFEDKEELKKFLLMKGQYARNALLLSITNQNENSFYFLFEQVFCKIFSIKEFAYESAESGENLLHFLASYGSVSMLKFALEKLKNEFSPEDLQKFIKLKSKNGKNLLHCAAVQNEDKESVEFLVNFIKNEVSSEKVNKMLEELDDSNALPLHCAVESSNLKIFELFFSLYEQSFDKVQLLQFLLEKVGGGDNLLHYAAAFAKSKEIFVFLWMKIENLYEDKEQLKKYLLEKGRYEKNALNLSIFVRKENYFYFLFDVYCKLFNIKEFAYETDEFRNNLFFRLASHGSDSMLIFTLNEVKKRLSHEDFQDLIKFKNEYGENLLNQAAENENCKIFEILLSFFEQNLKLEELKSLMCYRPSKFFNSEHAKRDKMLDKYRESPETQFSNDQEKR